LIHLDKESFADGYSCDISIIFTCEKCGKRLDTWSEGETIDKEFEKVFGFVPK
jgi:transcription initiation factor IIE alpha subunit